MDKHFLTKTKTSVVTLLSIVITKYGAEALNWDPVTLRQQIEKDYGISTLNKIVDDKIQAGTVLLTTDAFHTSLEAFSNICSTFNDTQLTVDTYFNPADLGDVLIGTLDAKLLEGEDFTNFSDNIKRFVGMLLNKTGIYDVPDIINWSYIPDKPTEDELNYTASLDAIDFKAFWEKQQENKIEVEKNLKQHIKNIFLEVSQLPDDTIDKSFVKKMLGSLP